MMGSSGDSGSDLYALVDALGNNERFQSKLNELRQHKEDARKTLEQAVGNNQRSEDNKKMAQAMLAEAQSHAALAKKHKEEGDAAHDRAASWSRALDERARMMSADYEAKHANMKGDIEHALAGREAAVTAREKRLLADIDNHNLKEKLHQSTKDEFANWSAAEKAKIEAMKKELSDGNNHLADLRRTVENMRKSLQDKLDKIKAISAA